MATTRIVIFDALNELKEGEFKNFKWRLSNIPRGELENTDRNDVADLMVQYYTSDAGKIAVETLRNINQNELADRLEGKLPGSKVPEDVPAGAGASSSEKPVPTQTAGVTVTITSNGGTVKAPVVHGCNVGSLTFN